MEEYSNEYLSDALLRPPDASVASAQNRNLPEWNPECFDGAFYLQTL